MIILPNPFSSAAGDAAAETSAVAPLSPAPTGAAADPFEFRAGGSDACGTAAGPDLSDPPVPAADQFPRGFDVVRFMEAIEDRCGLCGSQGMASYCGRACCPFDDPLPAFLISPAAEYLAITEVLRGY